MIEIAEKFRKALFEEKQWRHQQLALIFSHLNVP